jgi:hypothetical protein
VVSVTAERQELREKLATDYRMACPRGHTSLDPAATTPTAYCRSCGQSYAFETLVDRRRAGQQA